jgi:ribosomal-protein-alanine N-acetyltransferase
MAEVDTRLRVILRPMTLADVDQVLEMDRLAFPTPWPVRTYHYEIMDNDRARMFVIGPTDGLSVASPPEQPHTGWLERLFGAGKNGHGSASHPLYGYSGMWHIADEAHVSTIAIHPEWRGKKLGELLLWAMVRQAIRQHAELITLEVRVSNSLAQRLYRKYGFEVMGLRKGYYRDNQEDAYMMGIEKLDQTYRQRLLEFGKALNLCLDVSDSW